MLIIIVIMNKDNKINILLISTLLFIIGITVILIFTFHYENKCQDEIKKIIYE